MTKARLSRPPTAAPFSFPGGRARGGKPRQPAADRRHRPALSRCLALRPPASQPASSPRRSPGPAVIFARLSRPSIRRRIRSRPRSWRGIKSSSWKQSDHINSSSSRSSPPPIAKLAILHQSKLDRLKTLRLENKHIRRHLKNVDLKYSKNIWVLKEFR